MQHLLSELNSKQTKPQSENQAHLILLMGCPGVGKTTVAKELAKQTNGIHVNIDEFKKHVVPKQKVKKAIDPPEHRYQYYTKATQQVIENRLSIKSAQTFIIDDTCHLNIYRDFWVDYAKKLKINAYLIEVTCQENIVKKRLLTATDREQHLLSKNEALQMYQLFKSAFEPIYHAHQSIDTSKDIGHQVANFIHKRGVKLT